MTFSVNFRTINFKCNLIVDVLKGSQILVKFHLEHLCDSLSSKIKKIVVKQPGTKLSDILKLLFWGNILTVPVDL